MPDPILLALGGYGAQATWCLLLAALLFRFWRTYRRRYLLLWGASWLALAVYLATAGLALTGVVDQLESLPLRTTLSVISLLAGYLQIGWLTTGTLDLALGTDLGRRRERLLLVGLGLFGIAVALVFSVPALEPAIRLFGKVGLRGLVAGLAFLAAGAGAWIKRRSHPGAGSSLLALGLTLYGLQQVQYFAATWAAIEGLRLPVHVSFAVLVDLLLQGLIGVAMVVWLLEEEQRRTSAASREIERLASRDPITGLANREALLRFLDRALTASRQGDGPVALVVLDLQRFRSVNEALGPAAGDELLRAVARRLRELVRPHDLVARVAADEFAVVWSGSPTRASLEGMGGRIRERLRQPVLLLGETVEVSTWLGIARSSDGDSSPEDLIRDAGLAKAEAKEQGSGLAVFDGALVATARAQRRLELDLRRALEGDDLVVHYQPILEAIGGRIVRLEALVRWPREGDLWGPGRFLHVAEMLGLGDRMDRWILRRALEDLARWQASGYPRLEMAVNVSARLFHDEDLVERIRSELERAGVPASSLVLELTENVAMQEASASLALLRQLEELGVGLSIDDFGTGYSSLSYLRLLPVDELKIDRSFVRELDEEGDEHTSAIVGSVVGLASSLGLQVVAEGVETPRQRQRVTAHGCQLLQGFLFSPAVPAEEIDHLLALQDTEGWAAFGVPALQASADPFPENRRRHPRYDLPEVPGVLVQSVEGRLRDLSLGGLGLETASPLAVGKRVAVRLLGEQELTFRARVCWCRTRGEGEGEGYLAGLSFQDVLADGAQSVLELLRGQSMIDVEHRLFGRVDVTSGGPVELEADHDLVVKRLSLSGMLVETSYPARVGEEIGFEIPLDGSTFTGRGRFATVTTLQAADDSRRYETGVGFVALSPVEREMLRRYMAQRDADRAG